VFKFLKRLRAKKEEADTLELATAETAEKAQTKASEAKQVSDKPEPSAAPAAAEAVSLREADEHKNPPASENAAQPDIESLPQGGAPDFTQEEIPTRDEQVIEVELPKRSLGDGIRSLFTSSLDIEDLEDILLLADFGVEASVEITEDLRRAAQKTGATSDAELRLLLKDLLVARLNREDSQLNLSDGKLPYVFLVVGVNGAGKTTTIGKLAKWLSDGEWEVVLGAADTFRAAAVDQLATWAERSGAGIVRPERDGQDPASVAYQTVELAIKNDADIAIVDTAGRLQNKKDLMDELGKIRRAVEKQAQINEVLLVIDATTGQNAINQAKAFTDVAEVTGIVMTKLDGTAKGGIVYAIQKQLDLPVKLVGVGEGINDFAFFSAEEFAKGLVARKPGN
jgi:fused signal recognition particle receptor